MNANVRFRTAQPPAEPDDVQAAEAELGFPIPAQYRAFLLEHNGGELVPHRQPDGSLFVPIGTEMRHGRLFEGWRAILPGELDYDRWEREIEGGGR
jgi:cell wall assembly regulator SMI1